MRFESQAFTSLSEAGRVLDGDNAADIQRGGLGGGVPFIFLFCQSQLQSYIGFIQVLCLKLNSCSSGKSCALHLSEALSPELD